MSLEVYFREEENLGGLESFALSLCSGRVLDVGAGAGALSLILQSRGIEVESLEISKICCEIMKSKGVDKVINHDFFSVDIDKQYETILMMMNGIGICGTLDFLPKLFARFNSLLMPGGQVLVDSSAVKYLYQDGIPESHYFREIDYQGKKGLWFKWLYVDIETMMLQSEIYGYQMQVLSEDSSGHYLARLTKRV